MIRNKFGCVVMECNQDWLDCRGILQLCLVCAVTTVNGSQSLDVVWRRRRVNVLQAEVSIRLKGA
jgi:hypothetical protein